MPRIWKPLAVAAIMLAALPPLIGKPVSSGPTSEQIYCQNRAVNDYWDQIKACEASLSDLPSQLALCKSDAADDLRRRKAACLGNAAIRRNAAPSSASKTAPATR